MLCISVPLVRQCTNLENQIVKKVLNKETKEKNILIIIIQTRIPQKKEQVLAEK